MAETTGGPWQNSACTMGCETAPCNRATMKRSRILLTATMLLSSVASAQNAAPCRTDPSLTGYTTIAGLNADMQTELQKIQSGASPQSSYTFTLCPSTVFDATAGPLLPVLSGAMFICGAQGDRNDACIFLGGAEQIRIEDSTVENYPLSQLDFMGISFANFGKNANMTGSCVSALASSVTTATFTDPGWTDFDSDFVVRQTASGSLGPMSVQIDGGVVSAGMTGVVFDNDGGLLSVENTQISGTTAAALISTGNAGASFLQDSNVVSSSFDSVTHTSTGGAQTVINTGVRGMTFMTDVFYVDGTGSALTLTSTTIENNDIGDSSWAAVNVRSQATATITGMDMSSNSGVEFGVVSFGSQVSVSQSIMAGNTGSGGMNTTSAPVFAISSGMINLDEVQLDNNNGFSAAILALLQSQVNMQKICIDGGSSEFVVFIDKTSDFTQSENYVANYASTMCQATGPRLFKEDQNAGCFVGSSTCTGVCMVVSDQTTCLAGTPPTASPTMPVPTVAPTTGAPLEPTLRPTTAAPSSRRSAQPSGSQTSNQPSGLRATAMPSVPATPAPSPMAASDSPSTAPALGMPTATPSNGPSATPSITPVPTETMSPSFSPTSSSRPSSSRAPSSVPSIAMKQPSTAPTKARPPSKPTKAPIPSKGKGKGKGGYPGKGKGGKKKGMMMNSKKGGKDKKGYKGGKDKKKDGKMMGGKGEKGYDDDYASYHDRPTRDIWNENGRKYRGKYDRSESEVLPEPAYSLAGAIPYYRRRMYLLGPERRRHLPWNLR